MPTPIRKPLSTWAFKSLISAYTADVGATLSYPGELPSFLTEGHIKPRSGERNRSVGHTLTHPDANTLVVGVAYFDREDNAYNEDFFVVRLCAPDCIHFYSGESWEKANRAYRGTHWGDKTYLDGLVTATSAQPGEDARAGSPRLSSVQS